MIFLQLFFSFLKIGIFTFGGGYAMVALIKSEVVDNHSWISNTEFTDILAISQMTPGPIGINAATFTGYTAVLNAGYDHLFAILGALLASFAVILLPILALLVLLRFFYKYKSNFYIEKIFILLRLAVVGLIAAAALTLLNVENFGSFDNLRQLLFSLLIFLLVFVASIIPNFVKSFGRVSPILLIVLSGLCGYFYYNFF